MREPCAKAWEVDRPRTENEAAPCHAGVAGRWRSESVYGLPPVWSCQRAGTLLPKAQSG